MLLHDLGDGVHRLARAVAAAGASLERDRTCAVKAADLRRSRGKFGPEQRIKRHHAALRVLDKDELRRLRLSAIGHVRLQDDLIGAPELVEVIDLIAAEIDLQCREYIRELNAEVLDLFAVDLILIARCVDLKRRAHAPQLGARIRLGKNRIHDVVELGVGMTGHVLQLERPAADIAEPRQRGRIDSDDESLGCLHRADAEHRADRSGNGLSEPCTLRPVLHADEHDGTVGVCTAREDVEAVNGHDSTLPLDLALCRLLDLVHCLLCLIRGRTRRQLNRNHQVALIFLRDKRRWQIPIDDRRQPADDEQEDDGNLRFADELADDADIALARRIEPVVESVKETVEYTLCSILLLGLQHQRAECRGQRQRDEGGNRHRDCNRERKLLVEHAHHAAEEGNGDKDCCKHEGNRDNRPLHLGHRTLRRINRRKPTLHMMLDVLDDDDRIVDNEADCKHHRKECQRIDGEIQQNKRAECTNERHRHGEQRDERRAPTLQKEEDDEHDEQQCLEEGMHNLLDGCVDVVRAVKDRLHLEAGREGLLRLLEDLAHLRKGNHRIRIGGQLNAEADGGIAVKFRNNIILTLSRLNACDILQTDERTILA